MAEESRIYFIAEDQVSQVAEAIAEKLKGVGVAAKQANHSASASSSGMGKLSGALSELGKQAMSVAVGMAGVQSAGAIIKGIVNWTAGAVDAAASAQMLGAAFQGIASDADAMLGSLKAATGGMVSDVELMKNYNMAAQLVSKTFADQLPEAMGALQKVSMATGQSMDYMMQSLIRGVGRMSPMILDNLAIQVSLEEATKRAADMYGVEEDALSKAQQQAGMMSVVLEKLRANTASMPDVTNSAAIAQANLTTTMQNLQAAVGTALLPATLALNMAVASLVTAMIEAVSEGGVFHGTLTTIAGAIVTFVEKVSEAASVIGLLLSAYRELSASNDDMYSKMDRLAGPVASISAGMDIYSTAIQASNQHLMETGRVSELAANGTSTWESALNSMRATLSGAKSDFSDMSDMLSGRVLNSMKQVAKETAGAGAGAPKVDYSAVAKQMAAAMSSMESTWSSGMAAINTATQSGYMTLIQIGNTFRIESTRAEAEYQNKRAALIAEGNSKGLAELDAGYGKAKAMRELDKQIAIIQAKAKATAEIEEARRGFAQKMGLWLQEQIQKQTISAAGAAAIIQGIKTATGIEVSVVRASTDELLALADMKAKGVVGAQALIDASLIRTTKRIEEETAAAAASAAAREAATAAEIEKAIRDAYAAMGQFDIGGAAGGGAQAVEKRAEEVVADIAKTMEDLVNSIAGIMTTLSEKLPDVPADTVALWLDKLQALTQQVADWAVSQGPAFGEFVNWFKSNLLPDLQSWSDSLGVIDSLFSAIKSISDMASSKLAPAQTSVAELLGGIGKLFADIEKYVGYGRGSGGLRIISLPFDALEKPIIDWLESLKAGIESLGSTLEAARSTIDALVGKLPTWEIGTSIAEIFNRVQQLFADVEAYVGFAKGSGGLRIISTPFEALESSITDWLTSINESMAPLKDALESARSIIDSLVPPVKQMAGSVKGLFDALLGVLIQMEEYAGTTEAADLDAIMRQFTGSDGINVMLAEWTAALAPIRGILESAIGIINLLVPKLEETQTSADDLFEALLLLVKDVQASVTGEVGQQLQAMIDSWYGDGGVYAKLEQWALALRPVSDILSTIKGILDITSSKVQAVKASVNVMFDNLLAVMEQVQTQVSERGPEIDAAIAAFEDEEFTGRLEGLSEAIAKIKPFIDAMAAICDIVGQRWPSFRLNLELFFTNMMSGLKAINDWFADKTNQTNIEESVTAFNTITVLWMMPLEKAMDSASDMMNSMITSSAPLGADGDDIQANIGEFLDSLLTMKARLVEWLDNNEGDLVSICTRFSTVVVSALQILATGMASATQDAEGNPLSAEGMEQGLLMELVETITGLVDQIIDQFERLYTEVAGLQAAFAAISLSSAAQQIADSFVDKMQGLIDVGYFYDVGYDAGKSYVDGFNAATGSDSPSRAMIEAAANLVDSFVMTMSSEREQMYDAGFQVGKALEEGIRDALEMHSPSDIGLSIGKNLSKSIRSGAGGGKIAIEMEPMYAMGKLMGAQIEAGFRDKLKMHSPSTVIAGLMNEAWEPWIAPPPLPITPPDPLKYAGRREPTAAQRYQHQPGIDTARSYWERQKADIINLSPSITFAGNVSIRSDEDIELLADKVSRKLAARFSTMDRWGAQVT